MPSQALVAKLQEIARERGRTITYWDVAPLAGVDRSNPNFGALVGRKLDEVNRTEHAAGRPLLSAVVCGKESNAPGSGFFSLARALGLHHGRDDDRFWIEEMHRVNDYWSKH
jgi:hypothetical protein